MKISEKTPLAATILMLLCGLMMITSHLPIGFAADEEGGGGGDSGSKDSGGDSGGSKDNSGGDGGQDSGDSGNGGHKQESKPKDNNAPQEKEKDKQETNNNIVDEPKQKETEPINKDKGKGTPEEQEKAAIEDYIYDEPGIVKPYPPVIKPAPAEEPKLKPIPHFNWKCSHTKEGCDPKQIKKSINEWDCKNNNKNCEPQHKPGNGWKGDGWKGNDNNNNWCKWHHCGHEDHDHHRHNHKHNHHNDHSHYDNHDHNYYYYYSNDYNNNNHATVILQPDYSHSNDHHDIRVVIGDDYMFDTVINFAGEPENLVITGLDLNEGEQFDVCMHNEHNDEVNCVTAHIQDQDKAVYVDIRVP